MGAVKDTLIAAAEELARRTGGDFWQCQDAIMSGAVEVEPLLTAAGAL